MPSDVADWVTALATLLLGLVASLKFAGMFLPWWARAVDTRVQSLTKKVQVLREQVQSQDERIKALEQRLNGPFTLTARVAAPLPSHPPLDEPG